MVRYRTCDSYEVQRGIYEVTVKRTIRVGEEGSKGYITMQIMADSFREAEIEAIRKCVSHELL